MSSLFEPVTKALPYPEYLFKGRPVTRQVNRWNTCNVCKMEPHTEWYCYDPDTWRWTYICKKCVNAERIAQEKERHDPAGKVSFLYCDPRCSLTIQVPQQMVNRNSANGSPPEGGILAKQYTVVIELLIRQFPPKDSTSALISFMPTTKGYLDIASRFNPNSKS